MELDVKTRLAKGLVFVGTHHVGWFSNRKSKKSELTALGQKDFGRSCYVIISIDLALAGRHFE